MVVTKIKSPTALCVARLLGPGEVVLGILVNTVLALVLIEITVPVEQIESGISISVSLRLGLPNLHTGSD